MLTSVFSGNGITVDVVINFLMPELVTTSLLPVPVGFESKLDGVALLEYDGVGVGKTPLFNELDV